MNPSHWHVRGPLTAGATVVIFDLDGVIADAWHRQDFLHEGRPDWDGFFQACDGDPVIEQGRALAESISDDRAVVILTARPDSIRAKTIAWLDGNDIRAELLIVRPPGDRRSSAQYKSDEVAALRDAGYHVALALDDDSRIVDMYRSIDVPALYVHSGYYEKAVKPV